MEEFVPVKAKKNKEAEAPTAKNSEEVNWQDHGEGNKRGARNRPKRNNSVKIRKL